MAEKPPVALDLTWDADLRFSGTSAGIPFVLDSASKAGPSPMQALAAGLAGCMAMDVVHILQKGRHELRGLKLHLVGRRADEAPRRFVAIDLAFEVAGPVPVEQVERAIQLSREKYCSVWASMRPDIEFNVTAKIV
jgi:putative redox protein